jgi:transcriptional regulator with XRE-family HTH domain
MQTIPEQIINIRKATGLSQVALATVLGMTAGALCNYEKGRRPIRATDFERIKALVNTKGGDMPQGK